MDMKTSLRQTSNVVLESSSEEENLVWMVQVKGRIWRRLIQRRYVELDFDVMNFTLFLTHRQCVAEEIS